MQPGIFTGGQLLDPRSDALRPGVELPVEDGTVKEVSDYRIRSPATRRIDLGGRSVKSEL